MTGWGEAQHAAHNTKAQCDAEHIYVLYCLCAAISCHSFCPAQAALRTWDCTAYVPLAAAALALPVLAQVAAAQSAAAAEAAAAA